MKIWSWTVDDWYTAFQILTTVFIAVTVLTGAGAIIAGRVSSRRQSRALASANAEAAKANKGVADAGVEIAKAKEGTAKAVKETARANEEIARITKEAEQAKAERAEADKQIAIAKADALRAKEGIANAEARSIEASAEVSRLRVTVANAEKERAQAQKSLIELQRRIADRVITDADASRIIAAIKQFKNREFRVVTYWDDREPLATAQRLADILVAASWKLDQGDNPGVLLGGLGGIQVFFHPEASAEARRAAEALVSVLNSLGLSAVIRQMNDPGHPTERIHINVGSKPS